MRIKNLLKEFVVFTTIFSLVCWSISLPFINLVPYSKASGGIEAMYVNESDGSMVFLASSSTPEAIIKISAYDTTAGTNKLNSVTINLESGMNCDPSAGGGCTDSPFTTADLGSITATASSGISLWQDDGDGVFELYEDTLVSNDTTKQASAWSTQTITDMWGSFTVSQTVFSNLNLDIPTTYSAPLALFVVVRAENNIDAETLHKFMPSIPQNGVDVTSASISDFPTYNYMFMDVTLGSEGSGSFMYMNSPLMISEIQIASSTAGVEFIEIYNNSMQSMDLIPSNGEEGAEMAISGDLKLHIVDSEGVDTNTAITLTTNNDTGDDIAANGYFLIASTDWNTAHSAQYGTPDATYTAAMGANGAVYISRSETADTDTIDKVGWGTQTFMMETIASISHPTNGSLERKAFPISTPTSMTTGIHASKGNGADTNNNSADFITREAGMADPQNTSSATESDMIDSGTRNIVLNEILYNTASSSSWIELYNASSTDISINNWTLEVATTTAQTYTIPDVSMSSGSYVVLYWNQTGTNDTITSDGLGTLYTGNLTGMSTYGGDIALKNSVGTIIDYVQFGGSGKANESAATTAGEWSTGDYKYGSEYNESIGRMGTTGDDYNNSGDWIYLSNTTPGFPNMGGDSTSPDAVTNVVLTDSDATGFGLTGEDVRISWTPSATSDSTFDRYKIYILPDGISLDTAQNSVYNTIYGQYMWESGTASSSYAFTGSGFNMSFDSAGNSLSTGNYRAYIVAVDFAGNQSASVGSIATTLTSENAGTAGDDTMPPMIDHMSVWEAPVDTDLTFYARIGDDRDQCAVATAELAYRIDSGAWGTATSTCSAPDMVGNMCLKACSVAFDGAWDADTALYYYIRAIDTAGNSMFVGMYPTASEIEAKNNPIDIDFISLSDWNDDGTVADLTGTVLDSSGNPAQDAFIILNGIATTTATSTAAGIFTIPDNSMRHQWSEIKVIKSGYMEQSMMVEKNGSGNNFYLSNGYMSVSAGGSAGGGGVSWTAPMDGMMMAPTDISCTGDCSTFGSGEMPITIGFFNQMNSNTIDDADASNSGSNIYLTTDGTTKVSGIKVKYASDMNEARIYSDTALSNDTFYTVVITSNVLDTNGNPIDSNRSNGNYEFSFNTMSDNSTFWGSGTDYTDYGGSGMMMPPYVIGTNPTPGQFSVPLNAAITVKFSEAMDSTSINTTNIKLYKITSANSWSATEVTDKNIAVSLDNATKQIATISHDTLDNNSANNGWYEVRVMGATKSQLGIWMGNPGSCGATSPDTCLANTTHYTSSFQVSTVSDTTSPTISGSYPSNNDGITSGTTPVDVSVSSLEIGFSEAMSPSTINSQSITLKKGTVSISGTASYDPMTNSAKFSPTNALTANSVYTLTASTTITDLAGNALNISSGNNIISFRTGSADTINPNVLYANGDDYEIAITFSEPMNSANQTDTTNWGFSVLNPANYYINTLDPGAGCTPAGTWACGHTATAPYNTANGNQVSGISGVTITYDNESQTAILSGFDMCSGLDYAQCAAITSYFQVFIDNVKDKSGNAITNSTERAAGGHGNAARSPLQNSATTYGMLGPGGGPGMMMGGGGPMGGVMASGPSMDMGMMGMFMAGAFPMNAMAGQTSNYMIDVPVTKALQNGMQIILTFPTGFDVSSVAKDLYSPMNSDMNEWNNGIVTWDTSYGVAGLASTTSKTITIQIAVSGTVNSVAGPDGFLDSLHLDLKGIKNASIPKDFGTSGYTVDIKTKTSDGAILENISTMPFFITEAGSNTLTVVTNCGNTNQDDGTMSVYLGSPMTGPMEAESTTFSDGIGTSTFTNLSNGEYWLFTDSFITVGSNNYIGKSMPEPTQISGSATKNITISAENAGTTAPVSVYLKGNYTTDNNNDGDRLDSGDINNVDIFANSPNNFRNKTVTPITDDGGGSDADSVDNNGSADTVNLLNATNVIYTNYLTEGEWNMGVGPAMTKGPMSGPMKMPDWMEPQMIRIIVGIETATDRNLNPNGDGNATTDNANPVSLTVNSTDNFKVGDVVTFATGAAAATTTITAVSAHSSITVTPAGNWSTLPATNDTLTSVRESSGGDNDGKLFFDISTQTTKYIYGYVVDGDGNAMGNAEVYAYQPQGFGGGHTTSDTAGKFSLKVGANGVWTIGAFKQGMPNSNEKSVEVKDHSVTTDGNTTADVYLNGTIISDADNDNTGTNPLRLKLKRPGYTISGKVLNASSTPVSYTPVWAYQPNSWGHADTMTDSSGNYILYVDAGTWRVEADAPGVGWLQYSTDVAINSTNGSQSNINLRPDTDTVFYTFSGTVSIDGSNQTYMPIRAVKYDANGNYLGREYSGSTDSNGQYSITAPEGIYRVDVWTPSYGEVELDFDQYANNQANLNLNVATTTANITVASGDLQTISIQFTNGTAAQTGFLNIDEVEFSNGYPKPTGYHLSTSINGLSATSTIKLKGASTGKYYFFNLDIPGYGFYMPDAGSRTLLSNTEDCIKVIDASRDVYFTLPDATSGTITISGSVSDGSNNLSDAWVWLGNPISNFHTGTQSDSSGNFSVTVPSLSSGNYKLGADKPGYMSPAPTSVSGTASSTSNTITLAANTLTITGYVYVDTNNNGAYTATEGIPNAWVWAEEKSTGKMTHAPADSAGYYELGVVNGDWYIFAGADGYIESNYKVSNTKTAVTVAGSSQSEKNIALSANTLWESKTKSRTITPSSGGTVDDTNFGGTGVKMVIPPNALGSDSNSGNVSVQTTSAVTKTTSAEPFGGVGKTISATDSSGNAITNLDDYVDVELVYYKADVASSTLVDNSKLKTLSMSYWDNSSDNWVGLSTTREAYYKESTSDTEWILMPDNATTSQSGYEEFVDTLSDGTAYADYKLVMTAKTDHLTIFGATNPPDNNLPSAPSGLALSSAGGSSVTMSWDEVTTNFDGTTCNDLYAYEIYRCTSGCDDDSNYTQLNTSNIATSTRTYTDTTSSFTSYYYKVTSVDDGNGAALAGGSETPLASSTAVQVCSNTSIDNGTISSVSCAITCNENYTQSGNSCVANSQGSGSFFPGGGGGGSTGSTETSEETAIEEVVAEVQEIITGTTEAVAEVVETTKQATTEFAQKIVIIASEASEVVKANINSLLAKFGLKRALNKEQVAVKKYTKALIKNMKGLTAEHTNAITNFVAYGTDTTFILGEGERAGVVNSYKSAFGKLPTLEAEWSDAIKIANGRWPSERNDMTEANATEAFKKIYLREPDRSNPHDDAAVTVMAYGLRPSDRNLNSEKVAIKTFKHIYGYNPSTASAWDVVRAIAYSGATR